jgi:osmotically-inducible protein OsmY
VDATGLEVAPAAEAAEGQGEKMAEKPDEAIQAAVTEALSYEPLVDAYNVSVEIDDGVATLRGTVTDLQAKRAAAGTARRTAGVLRVKNRLKVRPAERLSDPAVKDRVEKALSLDPVIDRSRIDITVENGIATLTGVVETFYEKAAADELTAQVSGIVSVDNNLRVTDPALYYFDPYVDDWYVYDYGWYAYEPVRSFVSDTVVKESIETEYFWSPFVDGGDINVSVESGTATLNGHVDSWPEKYAAEENAREGGAIWVDNNLRVR